MTEPASPRPNPPRNVRLLKYAAFGLMALGVAMLVWVGVSLWSGRSPTGGKVEIGGPFTAVDHTGRAVSEADFRGQHMLVYFGFTFCPDVCPGELQVIGAAMDMLGDKAEKVTPVFFTVDPARDTPEVMADYVPHFHDRMVGLTGTSDQMEAAARAWRVYFARVEDDTAPGGYLMDHSSIIFLMDPAGDYVRHFPFGTAPEEIAAALDEIIP